MRNWMIAMCALLSAGAAQGQAVGEPYATIGDWGISADATKKTCVMHRLYGSVVEDEVESVLVIYDAQKEAVALGLASKKMKWLPPEGSLYLDLAFLKGEALDESWGSQSFRYNKPEDTHHFSLVFKGATDAQRILRDLAGNENLTLFFGPKVMTGLPLDASGAVEKLRECSLKLAGRDSHVTLPK